jgi:hypothetical protein
MKLFAVSLLVAIIPAFAATAGSSLEGDWRSRPEPGGLDQQFVLHITSDGQGTLKGALDLPDQGHFGLPIQSVRRESGKLMFEIPALRCKYEGDVTGSTILGGLSQGKDEDESMLLIFERAPRTLPVEPAELAGAWAVSAGPANARVHYTLTIAFTEGALSATVAASDQPGRVSPVAEIALKNNWLRFDAPAAAMAFDGIASPTTDEIMGTIRRANGSLQPVYFKRRK